ncbi:MAG: InlB B-repeat-containing protein [Firmicutes bacterium]|nr:InlB B-repeat-containing protein [Bacillota bacterium]
MKNTVFLILVMLVLFFVLGGTAFAEGYSVSNIDSYVGKSIVDFNYKYNKDARVKNYQPYFERYTGRASPQCVGYVYARLEEKLNVSPGFSSGAGAKDIPINAPNGKTITSHTSGKSYTIRVYKNDKGSHITSNSFVSFGATSNNPHGHVIYVEEVIKGQVYYTEGGGNYYKNGSNGTLKKLGLEKFISSAYSGAYVGTVVFESSIPSCPHTYNNKGVCTSCGDAYPYAVVNSAFTCKITNSAASKAAPYGAYDTIRTIPTGNIASVVAYTVNHYGNTWYKTTQGDWICSDRCEKTTEKPVLTIAGRTIPTSLSVGDSFGVRGTISTSCGKITSVYGAIINSSGTVVQSGSYTPNVATHNLQNSMNNDLTFGKLPVGSYIYKVTATATNGGQSASSTFINSSFTVVSTSSTVTIKYNTNGGNDAPASHSVPKGSDGFVEFVLSATIPTKSGYTFLGWRLNDSMSYGIDSPGQSISIGLDNTTSNTTLTYYAQWEETATTYTLTYDASGGTGAPQSQTVKAMDYWTVSSIIPTRPGYAFAGWADGAGAYHVLWNQNQQLMAKSDKTIYAVWRKIPKPSIDPPTLEVYKLDAGWIDMATKRIGGAGSSEKRQYDVFFGVEYKVMCSKAIDRYGIEIFDSQENLMFTIPKEPASSAETWISEKTNIYKLSYVDNEGKVENSSHIPLYTTLEKDSIYYWRIYFICEGQRAETDMQLFIFTIEEGY